MTQAFPLHWPEGWPRTPAANRRHWPAIVPFTHARDNLATELRHLGAHYPVISTNLELRRTDGLPYAKQREPDDPGVAVWFQLAGAQRSLACDRWSDITGNMRALAKTIEALRGLDRWGSSEILRRTWAAFEALPRPRSPWEILEIAPGASKDIIEAAFRTKARKLHPDAGGSTAAFQELNQARAAALRQATQDHT